MIGMKKLVSYNGIKSMFGWWPEYRKSKIGVIGLAIFLTMIVLAILSPYITPYPPRLMSTDSAELWMSPNAQHWLGTNSAGQDLFSRLLFSGRMSLFIGIVTALITNISGVVIGLIAGYFGGWIDEILMRIADILIIIPRLPLLIVLATLMGPGIWSIMFVISVTGWTGMARQIRALTLSLREYQYVESTKAIGAGSFHIIVQHILPNVFGVVLAHYVMSVTMIILLETGLSFLGFGDPFLPSWGQMLHQSQLGGAFSRNAWWWWFPPGLCITLLCASMAFIGTTLNDRFVLRLKRGGRA